MKAVDYFNQYSNLIMKEAAEGKSDTAVDMFVVMYNEIETICKSRNAVKISAMISAVKEVNQKWNKLCRLISKAYSVCPLKIDAIQVMFLKKYPTLEKHFVVVKKEPMEPFDPEKAKDDFSKMSQSEKLLVTMGMLGAYANNTMEREATSDEEK